jgi:hypothetical protein
VSQNLKFAPLFSYLKKTELLILKAIIKKLEEIKTKRFPRIELHSITGKVYSHDLFLFVNHMFGY